MSYHNQNTVPAGVRRFAAPSEGDSIFNNDVNTLKDRVTGIKGINKAKISSSVDYDNPSDRFRKTQ